jgi:radical SAM-linked protein
MSDLKYKVNIRFAKLGLMRFISHLDLMRVFQRSLRRTGLALYFTQGFSPHPKISFRRALKLGLESENEEAVIILREQVSPVDFRERLQKQLPEGIQIREVYVSSNQPRM